MLTSPLWGNYMHDIHAGLPQKSFSRPSGVADVAVCRGSGLLITDACTQGAVYLPFLAGTVPSRYCDIHGSGGAAQGSRLPSTSVPSINNNLDPSILDNIPRPTLQLDLDLFPEMNQPQQPSRNQNNRNQPRNNPRNNNRQSTTTDEEDDTLPAWNRLD
jgi:penicillin-binding protein 1A